MPSSQPVDGESLVPILNGEEGGRSLADRPIFWFNPFYIRGTADTADRPVHGTDVPYWRGVPAAVVMQGPYKLTRYFEDGSEELFNVVADPGERLDLMASEPGKAREMGALLDDWLASTEAPVPTAKNPDFDPSDLRDRPGGADWGRPELP